MRKCLKLRRAHFLANGGMCLRNTKARSLIPLSSLNYTNPQAIKLQGVIALSPRKDEELIATQKGPTIWMERYRPTDCTLRSTSSRSLVQKNGVSDISLNNGELHWKVRKNPDGDFFYGPLDVYLTKDSKAPNNRQVTANRAHLYAEPVSKNRSKSYIIKGDVVELLNISDDLKFWRVRYTAKDGRIIERWIECGTVNACP
ncbi:hypothetical protein BamIOP4010DRAFT_3233 [Burkholderia ambifaria IOP40-10]|uniref:SH3 domain-containing protein n=1 Tax=Burkholderia ambifaria IOP40-10 TaxID=396596 RepID=B1FGS3_9BURK|nr:hypothetical protein BamIOP4010DRAFT_3233 [Burkholderia ambifaria IOP40-10]